MQLSVLLFYALLGICTGASVRDCSCGFYDATLGSVVTDSTIVYFNETQQVPPDFVAEKYEHKHDFGWNSLYRQGASPENLAIGKDATADDLQSLRMFIDPSDAKHLVVGSSIRTARQDLFFGSFRSRLRSPRHWFPGSALSMTLEHNRTESWDIDAMNTMNQTDAWVSMLALGQFPDRWFGVNYTVLQTNGSHPWDYTEYRVDWTRHAINYYIDGDLYRSVTTKQNGTLPSTPAPLRIKHWSTGNKYSTMGPPYERGEANVGWVRLFFNSSTATDEQQKAFDKRCKPSDACSMDNLSLRGSTEAASESFDPWKQEHKKSVRHWVPISIAIIFGTLSTLLLLKTLNRQVPWDRIRYRILRRRQRSAKGAHAQTSSSTNSMQDDESDTAFGTGTATPAYPPSVLTVGPWGGAQTPRSSLGAQTPRHASKTQLSGVLGTATGSTTPVAYTLNDDAIEPVPRTLAEWAHRLPRVGDAAFSEQASQPGQKPTYEAKAPPRPDASSAVQAENIPLSPVLEAPPQPGEKNQEVKGNKQLLESKDTKPGGQAGAPIPTKRVDYLAGFIAMSALLVTANHFGLTYFAAVIIPSVEPHYQSEIWARRTIGALFLDPLWIGPFLMISTRFLVSNYIRTGNLGNMAQKVVSRPFRLLCPVLFIALLEYLLMDTGAINWLEYLPSVTWSSWPFTAIPSNFGTFLSEILQLAYFIPNGAPQIIYNYCTGVLWTIPVQLQGAWQTLLAVVMIREIKNPWKRFGFVAVAVFFHWYALSWGSYYYCGVMLADLDLTYKYTKWLWARPLVYYPLLLFLSLAALGGFAIDTVTQWTHVNYAAYEYSWHPDLTTGRSIIGAGKFTYPDFFVPRLNALISTVFMQTIVEISPAVQKAMSLQFWQWIFPHIFTIYLIHGFIFWSIGSWVCVSLFAQGHPWWLVILCTAICCYGSLFLVLPLLTPPIEAIGKGLTNKIWENASQEPIPRRPTLYPFDEKVFDDKLQRTADGEGKGGLGSF